MIDQFVTYEAFGAKGDGVTDDSAAIRAAHMHANATHTAVKTDNTATYYIGALDSAIPIMTDVYFGSSNFIIDDSELPLEKRGVSVFKVVSEHEPIKLDIPSLKKNQMKIDVNLPCNCYVRVENSDKKQFIRFGLNQNNGSSQTDSFVVDGTGYILNSVIWDFEKITSAYAYPIEADTLTVSGGIFTSIANRAESKYNYHARNIVINRSNTVIENMVNLVEGEGDHGAPYSGFITVDKCAYVTVRNCHLTPRKTYVTIGSAGKPVSMGSYALGAGHVVGLTLDNVRQNNIMDRTHWGLMGTNHCKNITVQNCVMSRFDAHENVAGLTIKNTVLGHQCFNAIGHGTMLVENVTAYGWSFLNLRGDYGSTWDGDVIFRNCTWYPEAAAVEPSIIGGVNRGDHDFGFPCFMPHKVTIDNMLICDSGSKEGYKGVALFNCGDNVMNSSGAVDFKDGSVAHPYVFTERAELSDIRTESGKGLSLFSGNVANCFCAETAAISGDKLKPNFRCKLRNVELPENGILPNSGRISENEYNGTHHILPRIELTDCKALKINKTDIRAIVKISDCEVIDIEDSEKVNVTVEE